MEITWNNCIILLHKRVSKLMDLSTFFQPYLTANSSDKSIVMDAIWNLLVTSCKLGLIDDTYKLYSLYSSNVSVTSKHFQKLFNTCCQYGSTDIAKLLFYLAKQTNNEIDIHASSEVLHKFSHGRDGCYPRDECQYTIYELPFMNASINGRLEMAILLYEFSLKEGQTPIDIHANGDKAFKETCENGHTAMAQLLHTLDQNKMDDFDLRLLFDKTCYNGHVSTAKWLYHTFRSIRNFNFYDLFKMCCGYDSFDVVQWLWTLPELKTMVDSKKKLCKEGGFIRACENGKDQIALWIYMLSFEPGEQRIDIHAENDGAFRRAMDGDYSFHPVTATLIYKLSQQEGTTIHYEDEYQNNSNFLDACSNNKIELVELLCKVCDRFAFKTNKEGKIVQCRINGKAKNLIAK